MARKAIVTLLPPLVALGLQLALWPALSPHTWTLFYPAVMLSAWLGGLRAGLIAAALSTLVGWWAFAPPIHVLVKGGPQLVPALIFLGIGALVSASLSGLRKSNAELRLADRSLREVSNDLERAQSVAGVGSWRADMISQERVWSKESFRILGVPLGTQPTRTLFFSRVHPDDLAFVRDKWAAAVLGTPYDIEHRIVVAGETRWIQSRVELQLDRAGKPLVAIGTVRDITEQKRLETEQQLLAELGSAMSESLDYERTLASLAELVVRELADFCIVDIVAPDGELVRIRAACRDRAKEWACETLARVTLTRGRPFLASEVIATKRSTLVTEVVPATLSAIAQDESHLRALRALDARSIMVVPLVAGGVLLGAIVLVASRSSRAYGARELRLAEEIAHRAALAIANIRLYLAAQNAIRSRDEVLGVVAHDLRNPLSTMKLHATMIREDGVTQAKRSAETIIRVAGRMNRLIEDLLEVARLESGALTIARAPISTVNLVKDFAEGQRDLTASAQLDLQIEAAVDVPDVLADRDRLLQVLENLIGNAIKFTESGGHITLGARARGHDVLFSVTDTGAGIAAEDQPHVFDRFWQARWPRKSGAGLGLAIAKGIVEAHGGRIWLESELGRGTTVYFTIPAAAPDEVARLARSA